MLKVIIGVLLICLASNCSLEKSKKKKTSNDRNSTKTGQKQNGLVKSYRSDGKVSSAVNYKDGIKHGVSYAYYSNGKVNLELPYANGKRTGQSKRFYETGQLYQTTEYTN